MTTAKPGFIDTVKSYPRTFWVANTMEIFERMSWYGFFAVSTLYITGPTETGGLGFTSEERGQLQAIVPFILYLLPVITGALADRYGYKKMFLLAYVGMIISYYALGQFKTFPTFLGAFLAVAVAAAIFKPVVVGTIARVTNEGNSRLGFGIFYMMVNVGGFMGPLIAGAVRGISWDYVFIACSGWAAVNLLFVSIFYRDPTTETGAEGARTLKKVAQDMVEVLGNLRFFITVGVVLIALMMANQEFEHFKFWPHCTIFIPVWLILNFVWDSLLPARSGHFNDPASHGRSFLRKRMHCSNWRFALFLLIMSGFWTSFNQIFLSMPEYIRDYTDTRPMVDLGRKVSPALSGFARTVVGGIGFSDAADKIKPDAFLDALAAIEETELLRRFDELMRKAHGLESMVPDDPPTQKSNEEARNDVVEELEKLKSKDETPEEERLLIETALAALENLESGKETTSSTSAPSTQADNLLVIQETRGEITAAENLVTGIKRAQRIKRLSKDPSLSEDDLTALEQLAEQINTPKSQAPLEVIDLVDAARSFLQYKVRIRANELGELMLAVPASIDAITDDELITATKTINKRLEAKGRPEFMDEAAEHLRRVLRELVLRHGSQVPQSAVVAACEGLPNGDSTLKPKMLALGIRDLAYRPAIWQRIDAGRQVNPEHIVNMDALAIIFLQVLISTLMIRFHRFTTMIIGMVIAAVGIGLSALAGGTMIGPLGGMLIVVIAGIVTFAIGEMMASPTSQDYVGRIAPKDKVALYMGYYFVSVALGNLFGGILSGQLYGKLARDMQRPDLMWMAFGGIMLGTAIVFMLYNMFALPKHAADSLASGEAA